MRPPVLNKRVKFQAPGGTVTLGHPEGWSDIIEVWAHIQPLRGTEHSATGRDNVNVDTLIRTRYNPAIANVLQSDNWRVVYKGRKFDISFVRNENEENQWLIFETTEGVYSE